MSYKIDLGIKKFFKMAAIAFVTQWVASHAAGVSFFNFAVLAPALEASLLAGAVYMADNWRKHRK